MIGNRAQSVGILQGVGGGEDLPDFGSADDGDVACGWVIGLWGVIYNRLGSGTGDAFAMTFAVGVAGLHADGFAHFSAGQGVSVTVGKRLVICQPLIGNRAQAIGILQGVGSSERLPDFGSAGDSDFTAGWVIGRRRCGSDDEIKMCRLGIGVIGQVSEAVGGDFYADIAGCACGVGGGIRCGIDWREVTQRAAARANIISRKALHGFTQGESERGAGSCG